MIRAVSRLPGRRARRRDSGPLKNLFAQIPEDVHALAHSSARTLGISLAEYVELLIRQDDRDENGRPRWDPPAVGEPAEPLPGLDARTASAA